MSKYAMALGGRACEPLGSHAELYRNAVRLCS